VEPGISIFRVRRKELSYPEEEGSRFLQHMVMSPSEPVQK
jgi:hypothetical protein